MGKGSPPLLDPLVSEIAHIFLGNIARYFMMHGDAQLASCLIKHLFGLAFADDALESSELTSKFLCEAIFLELY